MSKLLLTIFTLLSLQILQSCLSDGQVQNINNRTSSISDSDDDASEIGEDAFFGTPISWMNSGLTNNTLTIDVDNKKTIYFVGDQLHNYLLSSTNYDQTYCVEIKFPQTTSKKPKTIRVKAVPAYSNNFRAGTITRFMRVNLNSQYGNNLCNVRTVVKSGSSENYYEVNDSNQDGTSNGSGDVSVVNHPSEVCTDCESFITSSSVKIFKYYAGVSDIDGDGDIDTNDNHIKAIATTDLPYGNLVMRIDMNSSSSSGGSSCTNNSCASEGFDCCIDGQCVNEKSIKSAGVANDPIAYASAEQEKYSDPNWYKKYPQFYYICLESPPVDEDEDDDEPTDPIGDADDRFNELKSDYECTVELKANSESDPYHNNINTTASYTKCSKTDGDDNYYLDVMKRLYQNCGCSEKDDLNEMIRICPAYEYVPIYKTDSNGNETEDILSLNCYSPPVEETPLPFQDMEVVINSKSAPHRFFNKDNIEVDPFKSLPSGVSETQEGTEFQYLDDFLLFPDNGSFNMNSILGQFNVNLSAAYPAKVIDLEYDKQYIIGTRSGLFQGCPTCGKDSWFGNFSIFPTTNYGVGLQAIGYTTTRDSYSTNLSLGSYADTHFGRACFVPPTMIAYSHNSDSDSQDQREKRLQAQAALFANGYQRDWYGFNRGAIIGSFDGVTWFAIGKGRIVKSTSTKLFIAINAPFADLANPTNHIVSVQEYDFSSSGAIYDYDPSLEINDATQNEAGSCQKWHQCETDSDCITQLGWEYACADVTAVQTKWPSFNPSGSSELANTSKTGTIVEMLQQGALPPDSSSKRCVYRGAGAPCRVDYTAINDEGVRKALSCAPNFYCANLATTNVFNDEVARFGKPLDDLIESKNHFYGMDANVLGRPKDYLKTNTSLSSLPGDVQTAIESNLLLTDSTGAGDFGICRPGKKLPSYVGTTDTQDWEPSVQHQAADTKYRTDYISQIGGCNASLYTSLRYSSCPVLDEDGNYVHTQDSFLNSNFFISSSSTALSKSEVLSQLGFAQNSCGLESLDSSAASLLNPSVTFEQLQPFSAFKTIEGEALNTDNVQIEPTLAGQACLRKPGAVCHTDLDCSPNKLMAENVDLVPASYFGNNAEKSYFEEYLICGQGATEPGTDEEDAYFEYNITNNRCCREVGKSITMYTEDSPNAEESQGLSTHIFGGLNPTEPTRYSRYSVVDAPISNITGASTLTRPSANAENGGDKILDNSPNITDILQWKTVHDTAARTCCGSNWVREFQDGTNDWSKNRLNLDPVDFKCLNYKSALYLSEDATAYGLTQAQLDFDKPFMCRDSDLAEGGCIQTGMAVIDDFLVERPLLNRLFSGKMTLNTNAEEMIDLWAGTNNGWTYDILIPYTGSTQVASETLVIDYNFAEADIQRHNIITRIPAFITYDDFDADVEVYLPDLTDFDNQIQCTNNDETNLQNYDCGTANGHGGICGEKTDWTVGACAAGGSKDANNECCYSFDPSTRSFKVGYSNASRVAANYEQKDHGVTLKWTAVGTLAWEIKKNTGLVAVDDTSILAHRRSATPGNAMYYLKKLAKLEYLGVPQVTYEPLYCNDNYQKMVPGIFKESADGQALQTVMDFINHSKTFVDPNVNAPFQFDTAAAPYNANGLNSNLAATQELVDHDQIFSDNQFKCCRELGAQIPSSDVNAMCCSGYAEEDPDDDNYKICKLPQRTNLNVYFNKFISGEGLSENMESDPLDETDFDVVTGEPLTTTSVIQKLVAIGEEFCSSGVTTRGGAFGDFTSSPQHPYRNGNGTQFSIVDESTDLSSDGVNERGYQKFTSGVRWNHHIYCADD